ncbi:MAG TPA: TonB-dependent receptor plug domain-containing protein [Myxococcota bacterium]|nr:TonB-dependent receptor plug domain-containing protein [Myxococcota bacterium]
MGWPARTLGPLLFATVVLAFSFDVLGEEPSTVYVLTRPEIASLGAHTLPEVLRAVPGLHVTGTGERDWAVTSAGRGTHPEGRLLVLIDGRQIDRPSARLPAAAPAVQLSEIDRIELIRGRAAALWGKSAANGVLQIITTKAREPQGVLRPQSGG